MTLSENKRKFGVDLTISIPTILTIFGGFFFLYNTLKEDHDWIEQVGKPHILATTPSGMRGEQESQLRQLIYQTQEQQVLLKALLDTVKTGRR